jgi:hypothetical protein
MKVVLILSGIALLIILLTAPAFKKINFLRLFTVVMLLIYSIGILKLIFLFPVHAFLSLGAGMMAVLCMAFLFRQGSVPSGIKKAVPKTRITHWYRFDVGERKKIPSFSKEWTIL